MNIWEIYGLEGKCCLFSEEGSSFYETICNYCFLETLFFQNETFCFKLAIFSKIPHLARRNNFPINILRIVVIHPRFANRNRISGKGKAEETRKGNRQRITGRAGKVKE